MSGHDVRTWYWLNFRRWFEPIDSYCTLDSWGLQLYCIAAKFTHPGHFQDQSRPFCASSTLYNTIHKLKYRKQILFCNIVMVGHFTFGLCLFVVSNFGTNSSLQPTHWPTLEQGQMPEMLLHLNTENKYCFVILSWSDISHLVFVRAYKVVRDCKGCLLVRFLMHWT